MVVCRPTDGCRRVPGPLAVYGTAHYTTLSPGETVSTGYALLGHHANGDCLPAGTYRFDQADYLGTGRPWGFTVRLRE